MRRKKPTDYPAGSIERQVGELLLRTTLPPIGEKDTDMLQSSSPSDFAPDPALLRARQEIMK